jgi:hypothetical protein
LTVKSLNDLPMVILFVAQHDIADLVRSKSSDPEVFLSWLMPAGICPEGSALSHLQ